MSTVPHAPQSFPVDLDLCQQLLARAHSTLRESGPLQALRVFRDELPRDVSGAVRRAYASFLAQQQDYASAVAELSTLLTQLEDQPASDTFRRQVFWDLVHSYTAWGQPLPATFFLNQAIRLEAYDELGISWDSPQDPSQLTRLYRQLSEQLGLSLLCQMGTTPDEIAEVHTWIRLGMLDYLREEWQTSLQSFTEALTIARRRHDDELSAWGFLWTGRVLARLERHALARLALQRAANWDLAHLHPERKQELSLRYPS